MAKLKVVSTDFDSTLSDSRHRQGMIDRSVELPTSFWDKYSMEARWDDNGPAYAVARAMTDMDIPWIIVSGRSECARQVSWEWLRERDLRPWGLFLCDDRHEYMSHGEWKATRLLEIQKQLDCEIVLHYDDVSDVKVEAEKVGIPTVLVHDVDSPIKDVLG